jgi:hypothetical protein
MRAILVSDCSCYQLTVGIVKREEILTRLLVIVFENDELLHLFNLAFLLFRTGDCVNMKETLIYEMHVMDEIYQNSVEEISFPRSSQMNSLGKYLK